LRVTPLPRVADWLMPLWRWNKAGRCYCPRYLSVTGLTLDILPKLAAPTLSNAIEWRPPAWRR